MVSLTVLFGLSIVLFGIIGALRGWAKELLVTSAIVLGLFINAILETYVEPYRTSLALQSASTQFRILRSMSLTGSVCRTIRQE